MPKLSIIVPVYQVEEDIRQCITSVIDQDYQDWELILIDDCSPDGSGKICDEYAQIDKRIRVIHQKKNGGAAQARRTGIDAAKGEWIGFVDADDWIESNMFSVMIGKIKEHDVDIVACSYFINTKNDQRVIRNTSQEIELSMEDALEQLHIIDSRVTPMLWDKLYKRSVVSDYNNENEIIVGEDYSLLVKTFEQCEKVLCIDVPLYHYRQRARSVCNLGYSEKRWLCIENYQYFRSYLISKYPDMKNALDTFCIVEEMAILASMTKNNCYDKKILKKISSDVKRDWKSMFKNVPCPIIYKLSALSILISPQILLVFNKVRYSIQKKELY